LKDQKEMFKRLFDLTFCIFAIIPFSIICFFAAIVVFFECNANPIFLQKRVGKNKRLFTIIKLRTMTPETANVGSHEVRASQILKTGRFMRRFKIDELPQIINVLLGDMTLVGPRPCLPTQTELISEREQRGVYDLVPGITGAAQLAGIDMATPTRLAEADAAYASTMSFRNDLLCLWQTVAGGGRGDAANV
jgi:O-antigen biosynthesis protein WbqP